LGFGSFLGFGLFLGLGSGPGGGPSPPTVDEGLSGDCDLGEGGRDESGLDFCDNEGEGDLERGGGDNFCGAGDGERLKASSASAGKTKRGTAMVTGGDIRELCED
jgi:hypothetical protein